MAGGYGEGCAGKEQDVAGLKQRAEPARAVAWVGEVRAERYARGIHHGDDARPAGRRGFELHRRSCQGASPGETGPTYRSCRKRPTRSVLTPKIVANERSDKSGACHDAKPLHMPGESLRRTS